MGCSVTIVCSDSTRNGKTLLARMVADLLSMRKDNSPVVFDTDLTGNGIRNFLPLKTLTIDLSKVADQVRMFDAMLESRPVGGNDPDARPDYVIDLAANDLDRFFRIFKDIGFERGAFEAQLDVHVFHIVSWTFQSLKNAAAVRERLNTSRLILVRNMAIEAQPFTPTVQEEAQIPNLNIDLFLEDINPPARQIINEINFSFADFINGGADTFDYEARSQIWTFLEDFKNQTGV